VINLAKREKYMFNCTEKFRFAEFTLSPAKRTLFRERIEIKLRDKDFDVLSFLIESAPKTCSPDEIIETVWNGTNVENSSIEKAIANIRKVLGDDAKSPRFVKTIRSKGYLFIGDVKEDDFETDKPEESLYSSELSSQKFDSQIPDKPRISENKRFRYILICLTVLVLFKAIGIYLVKFVVFNSQIESSMLLFDDFSEAEINRNIWTTSGNSVKVNNGIAQIVCLETDNCGRLVSNFINIDISKPLIVESRIKVYASRNLKDKTYFLGFFGILPKNPNISDRDTRDKAIFGVYYSNYDYESKYPNGEIDEFPAEGWFLYRNGGSPQKKVDYRDGKVSKRIEPLWDTWFEQKIIYNPIDSKMSYFINGDLRDVFEVGNLYKDVEENKIRVEIAPRGWWLYHSIELDNITVRQ
jgi:DNA-binding winged helix-turn-helix (wHTH) protein